MSMENLDPLRQKPDFEAKANQIVFYRWDTENDPDGTKANNFVEDYIEGCEHVWTSHVEPLMKENDRLDVIRKEEFRVLSREITALESDRDKFAIEFAKFVTHYDMDLCNPDKTYTELLELYKESLLNQKP